MLKSNKKIVFTGGSGRFGQILQKSNFKYKVFFPSKSQLDITNFKSIAIVSPLGAKPCGPCRQIIHEYLGDVPIYIGQDKSKDFETHYIKDLLPYPFG